MNASHEISTFPSLETVLNWLLNHSWQAGVLVVLVLIVQWVFRRRITNRWRFALWWLVLARLLLPFGPESMVSVFNFVRPEVKIAGPHYYVSDQPAASDGKSISTASTTLLATLGENIQPIDKFSTKKFPQTMSKSEFSESPATTMPASALIARQPVVFNFWKMFAWNWRDFIIPVSAAIWLAGVLVLGGIVAMQSLLFQRKLKRATVLAEQSMQTLLAECQCEFGISRRIELLETDAVQSPALFGLFRLRLLLPRGIGGQFSQRELRYVFLHELAHVKRGDLWLNWLVTTLQIVHWFNPLVWFGFARLRADRELACDELALLRAGDQMGTAYGETIVKLLENLNRPAAIPGLVGILEDKKQMRRRIAMIAGFHKPSRWSALAIFLIAGLATVALTDAQTSKPKESGGNISIITTHAEVHPDLTGSVSTKDGSPLPVPATVFIATAAPKSGSSTFCPSCYADCVKHAQTDAQGGFKIESLDPQLTFQILVVAKGFKPKEISKVDPAKGQPVKIVLDPIESADATPDRSLRGRLEDIKGVPIAGAVVDVLGIATKDGGGTWGSLPGIDPMAVTDEKGEFLVTSQKPFDMMSVKISARLFADKTFNKLASGTTVHDLALNEGATLTGRVLQDGKPLAGVSIGISGTDRTAGNYLGHFEVGTGTHGEFTFANLPPDTDYYVYGIMNTLKNFGAIPIQTIHVGKDGETTSVGDLIVGPAHHLAGRVVLSDGQTLPPKTRLLVSREQAWDSMQVILDQNGNFFVSGIPQETMSLSVRAKGYHVSASNLSLDRMNPYRLIGRVNEDITNLVFKFEKGPDLQPDYQNMGSEHNDLRPLHGAEGIVDHAREWLISGRALDNETKQPIQNFHITSGEALDYQNAWNSFETVYATNGAYQIYLSKRTTQPLLLAEADGYLPVSLNPPFADATNVDFYLQRGSGPAGTVLDPDGKPAAGATLVLLNGEPNQAGLNSAGELDARWNKAVIQQSSGADGRFSFKPVWGMKSLVVVSSNGFAAVSLATFATNHTITLGSFGTISGTLKRPTGWGANEDLDVAFDSDAMPVGLAQINMSNHAHTDAQGRFHFDRVPPGHLQITYRILLEQTAWQNSPLQHVKLNPGQSLEVNITAADRATQTWGNSFHPPPPPKRIPGVYLKGVVLLPDGTPAADADVALQIQDEYLALDKAKLESNNGHEKGFIVSAGADGSFTLPMYEKAQSVIAINEVGIAQVSLEQLKTSPQITLQKWGTITGVLHVGHHLGTNEILDVSNPQPMWAASVNQSAHSTNSSPAIVQLPFYNPNTFKAPTDFQGRFIITFVPPGKQALWRRVPTGAGSWTQSQLATVDVKAGETTVANVGGTGRTVIGHLQFATNSLSPFKANAQPQPNFLSGFLSVSTPMSGLWEKARNLKTDAERIAFYQSPETHAAYENRQSFSTRILADGSFRAEDVLPGKYEVQFQGPLIAGDNTTFAIFRSTQELVVPAAKDRDDDSIVDWGMIDLKEEVLSKPKLADVKNK